MEADINSFSTMNRKPAECPFLKRYARLGRNRASRLRSITEGMGH